MSTTQAHPCAAARCRALPTLLTRPPRLAARTLDRRLLLTSLASLALLAPTARLAAEGPPCTGAVTQCGQDIDCLSGRCLRLPFGCFCIPDDASRMRVEPFDTAQDLSAQVRTGLVGIAQAHPAAGGADGGPHLQLAVAYEQSWTVAFTLAGPPFAPLDIGASQWLRVDVSTALTDGPPVRLALLLQQNGINYAGPSWTVTESNWAAVSFVATADDFLRQDASPDQVHPDFGAQGAPISIGFLVRVNSSTGETVSTLAIDNCTAYLVAPAAVDCNGNNVPDATDIANATSQDCNGNGFPDECEIAGGYSADVNANQIPDECEPGGVRWIADTDAQMLWGGAANWSTGAAPGPADHVRIDRPGSNPIVTSVSGNVAVATLHSDERFELAGGTFAASAGAILDNAFVIRGGGLICDGPVTTDAYTQWTNGTISGANALTNTGLWFLSAPILDLSIAQFTNSGGVLQNGSGTLYFANTTFTNLAGATYDFTGNGRLANSAGINRLINAGSIRKLGGTGTVSIEVPLENTGGTLEVQSGTLKLGGGGTSHGGVMNVTGGAALLASPVGSPVYSGNWALHAASGGLIDFTGGAPVCSGTFTGSGAGAIKFNYLLIGPGGLTLNHSTGPLQWVGETALVTGGTLTNTGALTLAGNNMALTNGVLVNSGTLVHSAGPLRLTDATLQNLVGGTYDFTTGGKLFGPTGVNRLVNSGTIRKSAGAGLATITVPLENTGGTLETLSGTLSLGGGGDSTNGTMIVADGATLLAAAATGVNPVYAGTWLLNVGQGGLIDFTGSNPILSGTFTGSGAGSIRFDYLLVGPGGVTFDCPPGLLHWVDFNAAIRDGTLTNVNELTLAGTNMSLTNGTMLNSGRILHGAGKLSLSNATVNNQSGAVYDFISGGRLASDPGFNQLINAGTIRKSTGPETASTNVPLQNLGGTLEVQSGALVIEGGGNSIDGVMTVAAGAALYPAALNSPAYAGNWALHADSGGIIDFSGGIPVLSGTFTGSGAGTIRLNNLLVGANGLTLNCPPGLLRWVGFNAAISGGALTNAGELTLGGTNMSLANGAILNSGTAFHGPGILSFSNATLNNLAGATYDLTDNGWFSSPGGANQVTNAGLFRKSGGVGISFLNIAFANAGGTVAAHSGTLAFLRDYTQTSGDTLLTGGSITSSQPFNIQGGRLTGVGTLSGAVSNTGGTVEPGNMIGDLTIAGSYTQGAAGTLDVQISGATPGQFDRLVVNGPAVLGGTLSVSSTAVGLAPGDRFVVLTASSITGQFAQLTGPAAPRFTLSHEGNTVVLTARPVAGMDFDQDGDVDQADLDVFRGCRTGPAVLYNPNSLPAGCMLVPVSGIIAADADSDGDVDVSDYGRFQRCFSGPGVYANPNCAD